jgi:predicted pyridoxine 5'-phosphate oxidase superfamily flavin-nucleotide-binding protein
LQIHAHAAQGDPLQRCLVPGAAVGLLGIEPHTRRRNRANGFVERVFDAGFVVRVQQSFGNCPKYIHPRKATYVTPNAAQPKRAEQLQQLDAQAHRMILGADTFFIATAYPAGDDAGETRHGVDVSHRGGPPGFVRIDGDDTLSVPDFVGNSFFNTIGNIALNPRAGLLFIDFESGDLLHLAVDAEILWNESATTASPETTTRRLRFRVRQARRASASLPLLWEH